MQGEVIEISDDDEDADEPVNEPKQDLLACLQSHDHPTVCPIHLHIYVILMATGRQKL